MKINITKIFSIAIFTFLFSITTSTIAAPQVFVQQYGFNETGALKQPLTIAFDSANTKEITATLSPNDESHRTLLVAFPMGEKIFAKTLTNGYNYGIYKVSLRRSEMQELLILSQGKRGTGKTALKEIVIIGTDDAGNIVELPINGFKEVNVLNSPLQIRSNKTAVLFRDQIRKMLVIDWNETNKEFDILGTD